MLQLVIKTPLETLSESGLSTDGAQILTSLPKILSVFRCPSLHLLMEVDYWCCCIIRRQALWCSGALCVQPLNIYFISVTLKIVFDLFQVPAASGREKRSVCAWELFEWFYQAYWPLIHCFLWKSVAAGPQWVELIGTIKYHHSKLVQSTGTKLSSSTGESTKSVCFKMSRWATQAGPMGQCPGILIF